MRKDLGIIFYDSSRNRNSITVLTGALETDRILRNSPVSFIDDKKHLGKEIERFTRIYRKVVVCFSFFTVQAREISQLMKTIQPEEQKKVVFVAGGPHPTGDPRGTLQMGFNVVVRGEGEETFLDLLHGIRDGSDYFFIKGLAYLDEDGSYMYTGSREPVNLDRFPPFSVHYRRFGSIEITRGCPHRCRFCQTSTLSGTTVRHRSVDKICKYASLLRGRNIRAIRFITPNALSYGSADGKILNISALKKLLSTIRESIDPGGELYFGSFPSEVRPEHVTEATIELITTYADNDNIVIGAQSGSQRMLDSCSRNHTVEDIYQAVRLTSQAGLGANVDVLFGLPGETNEDIMATLRMVDDLVGMGASIHAHTFMPLPSTPFGNTKAPGLSHDVRKALQSYIPQGSVFGEWEKQEEIARYLSK